MTDYIAPCSACGGRGYFLEDVPLGHPHFGQLFACTCTLQAQAARARAELRHMSNLEPFYGKTFAAFDAEVPGVRTAFNQAAEFARCPRGWFILFGTYGSGKTHLAAAIANHVLQCNTPVLFAVVPDLLDHLRATFGPSSDVSYDDRFERVRSVSLLILDDLGTENTTAWAREKLFQIVNHRYNEGLPTVITSNRQPNELDGRIVSRMSDRTLSQEWIAITAKDYRRLTLAQRQRVPPPIPIGVR